VERGALLLNVSSAWPSYLPNVFLAYELVYKNLYQTPGEFFQAPYLDAIASYRENKITLNTLNDILAADIQRLTNTSKWLFVLTDPTVEALNSSTSNVTIALRDNDVYAWAPTAPTLLGYCLGDDQVPYQNSLVAEETMKALGAPNVTAVNVNSTANHIECGWPALRYALSVLLLPLVHSN